MNIKQSKYSDLITEIGGLLANGRAKANQSVNTILVQTYWLIGRHIVQFEQGGKDKADYGSNLLDQLSKDLTMLYGKGFSRSNIFQIRQFYLRFSKIQTLSGQFEIQQNQNPFIQLSWSHYIEILKADDDLEMGFYLKQAEKENWSVRELKRQMKSMLFHRLALSKDKKGVLELSQKGQEIHKAEDILKDPFVLEFLNIPQNYQYLENELEEKLISNLQNFLLELGKGFTFMKRQYRISLSGKHFYVDLVFYHHILKCFVLIDLKRGEVEHQDIGQMNLYLNYFRKEQNTEGDNDPIGIVLGASKNHVLVEYATENISNQLFVSKYQLYLPDKKQIERELNKLLNDENIVEIKFFEKQDLEQLNYHLDDVQKTFTSMPDFALERIAERNDGKAFPITIFFEKRAVGFFVLDFGEDKFGLTENSDAVLLRSLSLNPDFQGKKIAKESMILTDKFVKTQFENCNEIVLAVNHKNQDAYQFYMKTGYADTGKTRPSRDGFQHILTKKL